MAAQTPPGSRTGEFVISRTFNAPRAHLWELWTQNEHLRHWFGPRGVTIVASTMDLRIRGMYHYCMRLPDGQAIWGKWIFTAIAPPVSMEFSVQFSDEKGGTTRHPFENNWPIDVGTVVSFAELGGKTTITVRWYPINPTPEEQRTFDAGHEAMRQGWGGTFENFEDYLRRKV